MYEHSTDACGTIRKNRFGFPVFQEKLQQGGQSVLHTANMLALKWHGKRDVYMLSTVHESSMVSTGKTNSLTDEEIMKPLCVKEYNQNKGAVDKSCMQMTFSESLRKSVKWYKKLFFYMMDVSVLNTYILFKMIQQQHLQLSEFKLEVIRGLVMKYGSNRAHVGRAFTVHPLRLTARHFPSLIPPNESSETLEEDVMFVAILNGVQSNEAIRTTGASNATLGCVLPTVSKNIILYKRFNFMSVKFC